MTRIREVCPVDPGKLDKLLKVLQRTKKPGSQGQPKQDWYEVAEFYGYIETLSGTELERISRKWVTSSHRIHANWSPKFNDLHASDRLRFGNHTFDIQHIENVDFKNIKVEIIVSEIVTRNK